MTPQRADPITQLAFAIYESKGVFAALLGSGLSRSAQIPTGWEITCDLVRRVGLAQGAEEQSDWAQWYRDATGKEPNYSTLLAEIASSPAERRAILHRYIEPSDEDREQGRKIPTPAHHAIAKLVRSEHIRVILTTNFDRLMENALREQGVEPTVVASEDALAGAEPITHSQCYILKLHGDYKDARILNTNEELSAYSEGYNRLLDRILDEHGLIVCGWSGDWDHALRGAFMRAPNRRYPIYWAARGSLSASAQELARHRGARPVPIAGADEFFTSLLQRVESLEHSQQQNPLSIDLLVSSTKRFLSKTEYRIQLDELVTQEVERLLIEVNTAPFGGQPQWSKEEFRSRAKKYESITEPLARMAGVLGRWGDGSETALIVDVIRALYAHSQISRNGLVILTTMRGYPAVLVLTAYAIGLTKAERFQALHTLFTANISREHHEPKRIVDTLFLNSWEGGERDYWANLEGLHDRKTPLSDHLYTLMTAWQQSFIGVEPNFELLFGRFEALGSLASFEVNDVQVLQKILERGGHDILTYMPMGRNGWHSSNSSSLIREIGSDPLKAKVLASGFALGSEGLLNLFLDNFNRYANRMRW